MADVFLRDVPADADRDDVRLYTQGADAGGGSQTVTIDAGIATGEAIGTAALGLNLVLAGVASLEAIGAHALVLNITPTGIASGEGIGAHQLNLNVTLTGVATGEAIGAATLSLGPVTVTLTGLASGEAVGAATVSPGAVSITLAGVATGEAIGAHALGLNLVLAGIASSEAVGSATLTPGAVTLSLAGVASAEAVGDATVSGSTPPPSGGFPWGFTADQIAQAMWFDVEVVDGYTGAEIFRLFAAKVLGLDSGYPGFPKYRDLLNTRDRVNFTGDRFGNATSTLLDAS